MENSAAELTETTDTAEIKETDIVFDCPHCGKSLAIDYRGAGLTIECSDCHREIQVPIPEGMELEDIDSSSEQQEVRIMHLRKSLSDAHSRIRELENALDEMSSRRDALEKSRSESMYRIGQISENIEIIESSFRSSLHAIKDVKAYCKEGSA
jgi:predicted  nucleic acid-binding Zn-ribbon protein